ncbi:MAG: hypothetical protein GXP24_03900 [Planctomycetes bacterium]|nr:hypothetical protein [Planctomycetota bacterium]
MRHLLMHVPGFLGGMILIGLSSSHAIIRSWDDGGFGDTWNLVNNWSPNGNPGGDDLFIGDLPQGAGEQTIVNFDFTIESLTITNGASADTDGNRLIVNGLTSIAGANTELRIRDDTSSGAALLTETLFIGSGAIAEMYDDSEVIVGNGALTNFGTIQGNGGLRLLDNPASPTSLFTNSGTLSVGQPNFVLNPLARTLAITAIDVDARVDLDGNGNGVVSLQSNATLDLDVPLLDPFSGDIYLGPNSTLDVQSNWQVDGNINVNSSFLTLVQEATIAGGLLSLNSGATVTLDETDEVLRFAATLSANNGSTLANSGTVIFDAPAQFGATANFNLLGNAGSMVVNLQSVEILQDSFDIDGNGLATNQVTVNAGAQLIFNGGNFGGGFNDLKADGVININGGNIIMDPVGNWTMDGTLNMNGTVNN